MRPALLLALLAVLAVALGLAGSPAYAAFPGGNGMLLFADPGDPGSGVAPKLYFVDPMADTLVRGPVTWPQAKLPSPLSFDPSGSRLIGGWNAPNDCDTSLRYVPWSVDVRDLTGLIPYSYSPAAVCSRGQALGAGKGAIGISGFTGRGTMVGQVTSTSLEGDYATGDAGVIYEFDPVTGAGAGTFAQMVSKRCEVWQMSRWSIDGVLPNPADPNELFGGSVGHGTSCDTGPEFQPITGKLTRGASTPTPLPGTQSVALFDVSPDGRWAVGYERYPFELLLRNLGTGATTPLGDYSIDGGALFSPDGQYVVAANRANTQLMRIPVNLNGGTPTIGEPAPIVTAPVGARMVSWQPAGTAFFDHAPQPGSPGAINFTSRAVAPEGESIIMGDAANDLPAWRFGDGHDSGGSLAASVQHAYEAPGTFTVTHTVRTSGSGSTAGKTWSHAEDVEIPAPELELSIAWDASLTPGNRFPIDEEVPVAVKVAASGDGVGALKGITFADDVLQVEGTAGALDVVAPDDLPDEPFELAPGEARELVFRLTAHAAGEVVLKSAASGRDSATPANDVDADAARPVKLGQDFTITIDVDRERVELEDIDEGTEHAEPVPVQWTIKVQNTAGTEITEAKLKLNPVLRDALGRDPAAAFPLELTGWRVVEDGTTGTAADNRATADLGTLAAGATKTVIVYSQAVEEGVVELQAIGSGLVALEDGGKREAGGSQVKRLPIDQPLLLMVRTDTAEPPTAGADAVVHRWGTNVAVDSVIENVSTTDDVQVRVLTKRVGNVVGKPLDDLVAPTQNPFGVIKTLAPGERLPLRGVYTSLPQGGTTGRVVLELTGWYRDPETGDEVEFDGHDDAHVQVGTQPGGWPATERRMSFDTRDAPAPSYDPYELGWMFTDSFARGFGTWVDGTAELMSTLASLGSRLPLLPYYTLKVVYEHTDAAKRAETEAYVAQQFAAVSRLSLGDAKAAVDARIQAALAPTITAWNTSDYGTLVQQTGTVLGGAAPDAIIEAAVPVLYASKLVKVAGKTSLAAAEAAQDASLVERVAAKGQKGFKPHDVIDLPNARRFWGVDSILDSKLVKYAQDSGLVITMRSRSPGSIRRLREGALPKIELVKAKNVNLIDSKYLGFPESTQDLAVFKEMLPWEHYSSKFPADLTDELRTKIRARYDQRQKEYYKEFEKMKGFARDKEIQVPRKEYGLNAKDNGIADPYAEVWTDRPFELRETVTPDGERVFTPMMADEHGVMQPFTGDMDMLSITDEAGNILDVERRKRVYKDLAEMGFQHPESLTWDNAAGRAGYVNDHGVGNPNAEPLLAYTPDGQRRAVLFDVGHSHWSNASLDDFVNFGKSFLQFEGLKVTLAPLTATPGGQLPPDADDPYAARPPYKLLKAGDEQAVYDANAGTPLVRRVTGGAYEKWTPGTGWVAYTPPAGPVTSVPQTGLTRDTPAGTRHVQIHEQADLGIGGSWFTPGDTVIFDPGGPNEERALLVELGSLILAQPLAKHHRAGELVAVVPSDPAPPGGGPAPGTDPPPGPGASKPKLRRGSVNVVAPRRVTLGSRLRCGNAVWDGTAPVRYGYAWQRERKRTVKRKVHGTVRRVVVRTWKTIPRQRSVTYKLVRADRGVRLRCSITASNAAGQARIVSKPRVMPRWAESRKPKQRSVGGR